MEPQGDGVRGRGRPEPVRLAVYTDYVYHRVDGEVHAERAFAIFLARLAPRVQRLCVIGRLSPEPGRAPYPVGSASEFVPLPYYPSLTGSWRVLPAFVRSLGVFWRALREIDCVWLLGPHPLALGFALLAVARGRRVVLGVRQDSPAYVRSRHPGRRGLLLGALALEGAFRVLARVMPVIVVGPDLARRYRHSPDLLEIAVSLVEADEVTTVEAALQAHGSELTVLSVGRLDAEKNPIMLAEVFARLPENGCTWRLDICGEGRLEGALRTRLAELGLLDRTSLRGYVDFGEALREIYRTSDVLLHISHTEGLPQVIIEALAAGLPVVATDVGGIGEAVGHCVVLVRPGDIDGAVRAIRRIAEEPQLRRRLVEAGLEFARAHTIETEVDRVATLLTEPTRRARRGPRR